jgi:tetratricopeptide (TPR) repeat protein
MDNLDYIESYFSREPDADRTREFDKKIESDPVFAEEVAFYLSALQVSREESQSKKRNQFREIYQKNQTVDPPHVQESSGGHLKRTSRITPIRKLVYSIATAAAISGIIFGTYTFTNTASPQQMARRFSKEHLQNLGVTMSAHSNSQQTGLTMYNDGKYAEALIQFETIIQSDTSDFTAKEYAGLSALQLNDYSKALAWFNELETYTNNYANPAHLYQALTLMERNQPGDNEKAKQLLQHIVEHDEDGKETAQEWLKKW